MKKNIQILLAVLVLASLLLAGCGEKEQIISSGTLRADANTSVSYEVNQFDEIHMAVPEGETALPCLMLFASSCVSYKDAKVWVTTDFSNGGSVVHTKEYQP